MRRLDPAAWRRAVQAQQESLDQLSGVPDLSQAYRDLLREIHADPLLAEAWSDRPLRSEEADEDSAWSRRQPRRVGAA